MGVFALLVIVSLRFADRAAWFFLLQALAPWLLAISFSLLSGRSIFVPRYLVFAHPFVLMYWGWLWLKIPSWVERVLFAVLLGIPGVAGLADMMVKLPNGRPAIEAAAAFLQAHRQPNDLFLAEGAVRVNRLRCYLAAAGARDADVRTPSSPFDQNIHFSHAATLAVSDYLALTNRDSIRAKRLWVTADGGRAVGSPSPDLQIISEEKFAEEGNLEFVLGLFGKEGLRR